MMFPLVAVAALSAAQAVGAQVPDASSAEVYHGRSDQLAVRTPKLEGTLTVDGALSEPVWSTAAILTGFSQYRPVDGLPAADSTEILVWYDDTAIHIGVRAFEPHGVINATLADRDRISSDDHVQVFLDTFHDRRRAFVFAVNPLGVQADGMWSETATTGEGSLDLSPDFVYESRGLLTGTGYEVEIRIPFKSIRYQGEDEERWGINVLRRVQHSGQSQTWTAVRQGLTSFLAQGGTLESLVGLDRGLVLDINPVVTARMDGAYGTDGEWTYDENRPEIGANVRWGVSENITLNATLNPDFSHVESDAGQLSFDPRTSLFFPEQRPFFLEGTENFTVPNRLVYTRRIADPVAAGKFTGKVGGFDVGYLSAVDASPLSYSGDDHPVFNLLRVRRDVGSGSYMGIVYTDRIDGADNYNRVAAADARFVLGGQYTISLQGGASFTRAPGLDESGRPIFLIAVARRGRAFNITSNLNGTHTGFRALSGFIGRTGIVRGNIQPSYTLFGKPGGLVDSWTGALNIDGTWKYDRFVNGEPADDQKLHFNSNFLLRGGWRFATGFLLESFKYPDELYSDFFIDMGNDTVPFVGTDRITNYDIVVNLNTPQYPKFSATLFIAAGRDENFEEWAPAWIFFNTLNAEWRPTDKIRVEGSWTQQRFHRYDDRSTVLVQQIPRLKLEYQVSRPIFLRVVGEYQAARRDSLRDNTRTDRPILRRLPDGSFIRELGYEQSGFRADALFSYQPTPGTVLFLGYGNSLASYDNYGLSQLRRQADGFFVKLSYLFRM